MSKISTNDVQHIAKLARIAIDADSAADYAEDLNNIFSLIAKMEQVETQGIEPIDHPLAIQQRLRPDDVTESNQRDALMAAAPATEAGLFLVPQVIESES